MLSERPIFISHSSKDEKIVTPFVEKILNIGLGISRDRIFYSSAKDTGPKSGSDFKDSIKSKIIGSAAVIQVITQNYKQSEVCLNEMGAAWVLSDKVICFILEPVTFETIGFIHNTTQLLKLNSADDLFQFQDDHPELYENRRISQSNFNKQVKSFIRILNRNHLKPLNSALSLSE
ncbi:TIR domain-containing protein [Pedobacter sp. HMF7647]|uniref:TIR domain-containing protein n=1 Tax=Hufsiella arboris TaxID=2695275 RepID=A0A7K1YBR8_9SPHI|nr:toll/interleukin-1 receptor domain-containing protein [Hufsiella arboris]MXV52044.1 TIR domain-containing protein [Hufsiella arboris]